MENASNALYYKIRKASLNSNSNSNNNNNYDQMGPFIDMAEIQGNHFKQVDASNIVESLHRRFSSNPD
jgi:hypothetical protein